MRVQVFFVFLIGSAKIILFCKIHFGQ